MAPHAEFDTEQIREKGRKDILYLLESVCTAAMPPKTTKARQHLPDATITETPGASAELTAACGIMCVGPWKEEHCD